jgi:Uma2 family endonuclease
MLTIVRSDVDAVVATQVTAEDLASLESDGYRYDLLAGDLIRVSPAGFRHGRLAHEISGRLWAFLQAHPELQLVAVGAETGFRLRRNPDTVLGPDAAVIRRDRLPVAHEQLGFLELAPDLAVEIVSPTDRWITVSGKVDAYLGAGVHVVWVIEPGARTVRVYTLKGPEVRLRADAGDVLRAESALPGFQIPLSDLFTAIA